MKKHEKTIAFFDFDGTITNSDSLIDFVQYIYGKPSYYMSLLKLSPMLLTYLLKWITNNQAKEKWMIHFFKDWDSELFEEKARLYGLNKMTKIIRPLAMERINWHKDQGHEVVIVSASMYCWLHPWCAEEGLALIATKLERSHGKLTGKFLTKNCHGEEKVNRIQKEYALSDYAMVYAYGDSSGDKAMLRLADKAYFKPFRE